MTKVTASGFLRLLAFTVLLVPAAHCARAPEAPLTAHFVDVGVAEPVGPQRRTPDASSATGFVTRGDTVFRSHTTIVPATRGAAFGFSYRLDFVPKDHPVRLTQVIRHPPLKKPDGPVIRHQISSQEVRSSDGHVEGKLWYILREDYEVVPGEWTVSLLQGRRVLLEQRFTVKAPS